jgi:hypothetical protein
MTAAVALEDEMISFLLNSDAREEDAQVVNVPTVAEAMQRLEEIQHCRAMESKPTGTPDPPPEAEAKEQLTVGNVVRIGAGDLQKKRKKTKAVSAPLAETSQSVTKLQMKPEPKQKPRDTADANKSQGTRKAAPARNRGHDPRVTLIQFADEEVVPPPIIVSPLIKVANPQQQPTDASRANDAAVVVENHDYCALGKVYGTCAPNGCFVNIFVSVLQYICAAKPAPCFSVGAPFVAGPSAASLPDRDVTWARVARRFVDAGATEGSSNGGWLFEYCKQTIPDAQALVTLGALCEPLFRKFLVFGFEDVETFECMRAAMPVEELSAFVEQDLFLNRVKVDIYLKGQTLLHYCNLFLDGKMESDAFAAQAAAQFLWTQNHVAGHEHEITIDDYICYYALGDDSS